MTTDPLRPLVDALRHRAHRQAVELLAEADADAHRSLATARAEADRLLAEARAEGAADGARALAAERTNAERQARSVVLAAQREAYEHARSAARSAVGRLRAEPVYADLLAALQLRARRQLGPEATITELPGGGIAATRGDRRLEFALEGLADDLLEDMGQDLQELWSP